jgi:hypothetical protein
MKTAVCLFVKDERLELLCWLGSFIVYDDFFQDSTECIILSLKKIEI